MEMRPPPHPKLGALSPPPDSQPQGEARSIVPSPQANQAETSQQPPQTVPWAEYEALRLHMEGMQALRDMARVLQGMMPGGALPPALERFVPERKQQQGPLRG